MLLLHSLHLPASVHLLQSVIAVHAVQVRPVTPVPVGNVMSGQDVTHDALSTARNLLSLHSVHFPISVHVLQFVRQAIEAMAVCVNVLYELTDDATVTTMEAPVACAVVHLTYMASVKATVSAIVCVLVVAYVPPAV